MKKFSFKMWFEPIFLSGSLAIFYSVAKPLNPSTPFRTGFWGVGRRRRRRPASPELQRGDTKTLAKFLLVRLFDEIRTFFEQNPEDFAD